MKDWVKNLKPGDKVIVDPYAYARTIDTVERTTKTLIITKGKRRFNKESLYEPGDGWIKCYLRRWNEESEKIILLAKEKRELIARIVKVQWRNQSIGTLKKILEIVK